MMISRALCSEIIHHAVVEAPREACGLIGMLSDECVAVFPADNVSPEPRHHFQIAPVEQYRFWRDTTFSGELGAMYHSHPRGPGEPSESDLRFAFIPDLLHVICDLTRCAPDEDRPLVYATSGLRVFRIVAGVVHEEELSVVE